MNTPGTPLGDPVEASAIGQAFRTYRSHQDPLYLYGVCPYPIICPLSSSSNVTDIRGSVKSNIGHLEGGSGVAGVIKAILALENGIIAPNANFERLNPKINAEFLNIKVRHARKRRGRDRESEKMYKPVSRSPPRRSHGRVPAYGAHLSSLLALGDPTVTSY